ncbi:PrsW family intramembrane metalloprotease [Salinibaculum rarum]|uniref:PrsW family intramembrane metalloprotease n=1 Tax=Salinibaculum rarum TaxID=3058903 RepID=UPI00265DE1D0|nr:PrsW family glutamic-type intramembrane protease [Salinibaculum sp. KK48]
MSGRRDPVQQRDDGSMELQDVVTWRPASLSDRVIYRLYRASRIAARIALVVLAVLILATQFALGGLGALTDPLVGAFVVLSAVPALVLAAYIWYADVTTRESLRLLVVTFVLGFLFAGFAGVLNVAVAEQVVPLLFAVNLDYEIALAALFLFVVAPIEECVKLLAVWLYAYRKPAFNAVVVGAVYGAMAGLGFATIENAIYITRYTDSAAGFSTTLAQGTSIATQRALAGPGHVIYSAFAGYYLGLAKFNREYAVPIVIKGLLAAIFIHGGYNVLVSHVPDVIAATVGLSNFAAVVVFIIAYDGLFAVLLGRKLSKYRAVYEQVHTDRRETIQSELTEFDP